MAARDIIEPTPFMKTLTKQQYDSILLDVQDRIKLGLRGLSELRSAINRNSDPAIKLALSQNKNPKKLKLFIYENIKNGYDDLGFKIDSEIKSEIKQIYNKYFAQLKKAGDDPEYLVDRNGDKSILIFDTQGLSAWPGGTRQVLYDAMANFDIYAAKGVLDYPFRHLLNNESFSEAQFIIFQETAIRGAVFSLATFYGDVLRKTVSGTIGSLQAIEEKLKNYTAGSDKFLSDAKTDATDLEDSNVTILADQFNKLIASLGVNFSLGTFISMKYGGNVPSSKLSEKLAYQILEPSQQFKSLNNSKYAQTIFNKIINSGLMDLIASSAEIGKFAQLRFSAGANLIDPATGSAANVLDPVRDTIWLNDLSNAITNLSRDPITLAILQQYFPNVVTLFFNAVAASADYSGGSSDDPINNVEELAKSLISAFGVDENGKPVFQAAWDLINTGQRIKSALEKFPFRENIPPKTPDIFHLRLGASNFYVPPVAININSQFKTGSLTGGALRQKNSPKFNAGYKETTIGLKLFFPNYEEIWGLSIDGVRDFTIDKDFKIDFRQSGNEDQIDKFLSSLRGLVAAFKYAPILPIKNHYLNTVHGISGVALSSMSISTIPNYPFALVVDLELFSFNHKPFLPMIKDFNQAVHWGKFRHYMGKAAGHLHSYINESFFLGTDETMEGKEITAPGDRGIELIDKKNSEGDSYTAIKEPDLLQDPFKDDIFKTNVIKEWRNGNNISLFVPQQTQTKIFTPDTSSFRSDEEKLLEDTGGALWQSALKAIGIDVTYGRSLETVVQTSLEGSISPSARRVVLESMEIILAGKNQKEFNQKAYDFYAKAFVAENKTLLNQDEIDYILTIPGNSVSQEYTSDAQQYRYKGQILERNGKNYSLKDVRNLFQKSSENVEAFMDSLAINDANAKARTTGKSQEDFIEQSKEDIARSFNVLFYNRFFKSGPIQKLLEAKRLGAANYQFNEWEVPMYRVDLDPKAVIVNGVSVTLGNNLVKLQLQMQEEPTYQHIGGKDTYMNISMTVFGERELIKLRKVFEHINGLARLEHSTGVIGFMGIKNIVAGLAGMKYVMPLSYQVDTIPNFPHVYDVKISFVDFDIFQQQREKLSSKQQADMVKVFGTKKNPFLRIKQLWGSFNAYPDFPLAVKNEDGETVGTLDPDYYFRSFEMFDEDIVNHLTSEEKKLNSFAIPAKSVNNTPSVDQALTNKIINEIKEFVINNEIAKLKRYFDENQIGLLEASAYVQGAVREFLKGQKSNLLTDFIDEYPDTDEESVKLSVQRSIGSGGIKFNTKVGQVAYHADTAAAEIQSLLNTSSSNVSDDGFVSINTEDLTIHHMIELIPALENTSEDKLPAILYHSQGYHLGYVGRNDNRFYFTLDGVSLMPADKDNPNDGKINYVPISIPFSDTDSPSKTYDPEKGSAHIPALGGTGSNLARTHEPYSQSDSNTPQVMATKSTEGNVAKHWERMLVDTRYRDISGRMIRAFPTYMLWLIDEGGYFAGVKLFDNFYGLQSIIDFSIVQSEDILGDTLILRVSNLYSKLTTPESSSIFRVDEEYAGQPTNATEGIESVLDTVLNRARNMAAHMVNDYVVDINNIRLKPGVRVHLRGGYGANPNALQTLFNGVITAVENGEIVTITAQSDAIELSPIVNSTNKKGDSGKIDGGINTGFWLSEPRDLMVRLLSMGSSRTREAISHATRGIIFSENKFGIRHFGQILYQPLNDLEKSKNDAVVSAVEDAFMSMGEGSGNAWGLGSALGVLASGDRTSFFGSGPEIRVPGLSLMRTLWSNFSAQRDFEIFKRNIYPGNGTGIAQFLGGDLGDGWGTVASLTPDEKTNERINYIGRVTDMSWNRLTSAYDSGNSPVGSDAKVLIDTNTQRNVIGNRNGSADISKKLIGGAIAAAGIAITGGLGAPIIGGITAGVGLTGVLSGRGGTNIFNALGITSSLDDDLPGLDEVSFRAQTYMRSVWDIFQMCARLLPNYIVAIRPFEDRSTVFYGKPHWLYTSGVVPLTTGYPARKEAERLGVSVPREVDPDAFLAETMAALNKESNPLADAAAFSTANTSLKSIEDALSQQLNPGTEDNIYLPSEKNVPGSFREKVIPFGYKSTMVYRNDSGDPVSQLPSSFGYATVGYHLPIGGDDIVETELNQEQIKAHRQIPELPLRYRFPFFTDRKDGIILEDFAYYALADELGTWNNYKADYMTLLLDEWSYNGQGGVKQETNWIKLLKLEAAVVTSKITTDNSNLENRNGLKLGINMKLADIPLFNNLTELDEENGYVFSERISQTSGSTSIIRVPLPDLKFTVNDSSRKIAQEYSILSKFPSTDNPASLAEWGSPSTALEEQFYIAMKWPYSPSSAKEGFYSEYIEQFNQLNNNSNPVGTAKDYKNRKVMVYSPTTGKAVVCKPAYYLWGNDTVRTLGTDENLDQFGNIVTGDRENGTRYGNGLLLENERQLSAVVSPDVAYFLGILNLTPKESDLWSSGKSSKDEEWFGAESAIKPIATAGIAPFPMPRACYYAFVPDDTPLGVVPDFVLPADEFILEPGTSIEEMGTGRKIVSFGTFSSATGNSKKVIKNPSYDATKSSSVEFFELQLSTDVKLVDAMEVVGKLELGGNIYGKAGGSGTDAMTYFDLVKTKNYSVLEAENLRGILEKERSGEITGNDRRFALVYDEVDVKSADARRYYDEDFDPNVGVIAGGGRTLQQALSIWDQFRVGYHTYTNVKESFQRAYGLDPDSEEELPTIFGINDTKPQATAADFRMVESAVTEDEKEAVAAFFKKRSEIFKKYGTTAEDEFTTVFGDQFFKDPYKDYIGPVAERGQVIEDKIKQGLEVSRENFIDAGLGEDGLIEYFNSLLNSKINTLREIISTGIKASGVQESEVNSYIDSIRSPKQLFLFLVGAFRNKMWGDPYSRAWLVLKPNKKLYWNKDEWDFNPVLKIFQAFIDPNSTYAKDDTKFRKLLAQNRAPGSNSSFLIGKAVEDIDGFWDKNVGPLFSALGDSLTGLVNLFRMSMMQLGYGLSQVGQMSKQANVLNKVLNDSIYYSLGRPGSLLRAVDNPFTREYGEPVIEIRQPFQRLHYISSFSHILANNITENINGVATMVTAVSDGKYPVTVAMDKSAPSERQVEKTVETGLFFDNATGSGLFGALHPIFHPFEFARGVSKAAQGTPDELLAKRVALSHLKDSLKDIYTGEIIVIGNPDIRPHDIVYIADAYEKMYGMFEVEQVVHHFTSELGFITSITPNALVTVNDPARWFMSSWIGTWMHMQALRNDTRLYMSALGSGINNTGQISLDGLAESLQTQMVGGIQYTHGAAALTKDIMAHYTSEGINDINAQVKGLVAQNSAVASGQASIGGLGAMFAAGTALGGAAGAIAALAIPGAGPLISGGIIGLGSAMGGRTAWKGWSWIRDNVLDQHGCYIQYLNQNGKPLDAGLNQSGQGMVVGRYHTKKLLPGILGVSQKVKTVEGYSFIRTNDLLKNLGWKEKEINDLVRYIDFENALVNSQILKYSGIGPEKAGLNRFFKVICRVKEVIDGDTIDVYDILDSSEDPSPFRIRFDGVNTPELNVIKSDIPIKGKTAQISSFEVKDLEDESFNEIVFTTSAPHNFSADDVAILNIDSQNSIQITSSSFKIEKIINSNTFTGKTSHPVTPVTQATGTVAVYATSSGDLINNNSPGGKALAYTKKALQDKIIILRISPVSSKITASFGDANFEAGGQFNSPDYYEGDVFSDNDGKYEYNIRERIMAVVFYNAPDYALEKIAIETNALFSNNKKASRDELLNKKMKPSFGDGVFFDRFNEIFEAVRKYAKVDYFEQYSSSSLKESGLSESRKQDYNAYFGTRVVEFIYDKVSEWPNVEWDEYYEDGTPVSLNYELITKGLAKVYTKGLLIEQPSVIDSTEMAALPSQIK